VSRRRRRWALFTGGAAILIQLVVLYAPSAPGGPTFAHVDKLVHAAVFALPVLLLLLARLPWLPVVALVAAHAPVSEIVQARLLADRAGDPWDAVADLVGVGLGALAAHLAHRRDAGSEPVR
jgi:hypothetical protein